MARFLSSKVRPMLAAVLTHAGSALELVDVERPTPGPGQVLVRVDACAICRTDLHVIDNELKGVRYPIIPGHEIVGSVVEIGSGVERFSLGDRVGIPWLGHTCDACRYCLNGQENLCDHATFTGHSINGGFAEFTVANAEYCFTIDGTYDACEAAPLLCAGLIGYRTLKFAGEGIERLGVFGFGAAAHIVAQVATFKGVEVFAFTRPGDHQAQEFATELGACWAGGSDTKPPQELDAALIFAPVGALVPTALQAVRKGGTVVCGGIHMSDIPGFPYDLLWGERAIRSVANLTRRDAEEFLALAPLIPVRTSVMRFPLPEIHKALKILREGQLSGAAVVIP